MTLKVDWQYDPADRSQSRTMGDWLALTRRQWFEVLGILALVFGGALVSGIGH